MDPVDAAAVTEAFAEGPGGLVMLIDGSIAAVTFGATKAWVQFLDGLPPRPKTALFRWVRRHRVRLRKAVPILAPLSVGLLRAIATAYAGGDPIAGFVFGAFAALLAVGLNELRAAPEKVLRAGAPDDGAGQ